MSDPVAKARTILKDYRATQAKVQKAWDLVEKTESFTDIRRAETLAQDMYEEYTDALAGTVDDLLKHIDALGGTK